MIISPFNRSKPLFIIRIAGVFAVLLFSRAVQAADPSGEWQRILEAAKREGRVVVSIPPSAELRKMLKEVFEKRFGIELELVTGRGSQIIRRIADEHKAGVHYFDVHTGGSGATLYGLAEIMDAVEPYVILPEVKDPKHWWGGHMYVDKGKRYVYSFLAFVQEAVWYNTELMSPDEVRTYDDLLRPKWSEKIGYSDPRGWSGARQLDFSLEDQRRGFFKKARSAETCDHARRATARRIFSQRQRRNHDRPRHR
jgi:ABC-type thiamine transport system substrate-binding protein